MASMNRVTLIGNIGDKPTLRTTGTGKEVSNFSLATKEISLKDNQKTEQTEWHRIVVWGKTAQNCANYLDKGSLVCVEGRLQTRKFNKNGFDQYTTEIIASNVIFLSNSKKTQEPAQESSNTDAFPFSEIPF